MNKLLKTLAYVVMLLFMLFVGVFAYQVYRQSSTGKEWCNSVIQGYESDPAKFLRLHSDRIQDGRLRLRPSQDYSGAMGDFTVDESGEFECRYWHGGFIGLHGNRYSSQTKTWEPYD